MSDHNPMQNASSYAGNVTQSGANETKLGWEVGKGWEGSKTLSRGVAKHTTEIQSNQLLLSLLPNEHSDLYIKTQK